MRPRLALLTALVAASLALPAGAGGSSVALDGHRRTSHSYAGDLSGFVVGPGRARPAQEPAPEECDPASCSETEFRLRLPVRRNSGRFMAVFTFSDVFVREVGHRSVLVVLLDAQGQEVERAVFEDPEVGSPADPEGTAEQRRTRAVLVRSRLAPGIYLLRAYNMGAPVHFEATTSWTANAPVQPTR